MLKHLHAEEQCICDNNQVHAFTGSLSATGLSVMSLPESVVDSRMACEPVKRDAGGGQRIRASGARGGTNRRARTHAPGARGGMDGWIGYARHSLRYWDILIVTRVSRGWVAVRLLSQRMR